jgi:hypothetical protein
MLVMQTNVVNWNDIRSSEETNPDNSYYKYRLLAEGDSWFSMGGMTNSNLLQEMRLSDTAIIANCAYPGDTTHGMEKGKISRIISDRRFRDALKSGYEWHAILLSAGGNDLIDAALGQGENEGYERYGHIILPRKMRPSEKMEDAADYCNSDGVARLVEDVLDDYRALVRLRDATGNEDVPMICHTYDWATPRNSPARVLLLTLGPWLYPVMTRKDVKIPEEDWLSVAKYLIASLGLGILSLADELKNFFPVKTWGILNPASTKEVGSTSHWLNEIHPTAKGYRKIAREAYGPEVQRRMRHIP